MAEIKVNDNGPLTVKEDVKLVDGEGNAFETKKVYSLCRCGKSTNKPYCDGSHKGEFEDQCRA